MGKLWAVVRREYMERVRTKWFAISTVLAPIFFGVLDATGTDLGQRIAFELAGGIFGDTTAGRLVRVSPERAAAAERDALAAVRAGRATGALLLDGRSLTHD